MAKNTFDLYVRMLFLMIISLYTSRVVLQALGAVDFGTYNVVGGVVLFFSFINAAMTTGMQRHLSFELGSNEGRIDEVFSACLNIHLGLAVLIILLSETVGLWFVNTQLVFPEGKMSAVNWVYQFSIVACVFNLLRVPYNAAIIAYERMSFYAFIGILEGLLKLLVVFLLVLSPFEKVVYYSLLICIVTGTITLLFVAFCRLKLDGIRYVSVPNGSYKNLLSFSGWTLFGSFANVTRNQGITFIVNVFYGVTMNAALGIANQVNAGVSQFVNGFQQAFNPQLTKIEASKDREHQSMMINMTAKLSFFLVLFVSLPILYNLGYVLRIWLGDYPEYTRELCLWIVIATMIDSISGPLWISIFATGKIIAYQLYISLLLLLNLPLAIICGKVNWPPHYIFIFYAIINLLAIIVRLLLLNRLIRFNITRFVKDVVIPITVVSLLIAPFLIAYFRTFSTAESFKQFILQSVLIVLYEFFIISFIGLKKNERLGIIKLVRSRA